MTAASPIAEANALIARARSELGGVALVGLSGGKDSLVTLDLVARSGLFDRVACYHMAIVPGIEIVEGVARRVAARIAREAGITIDVRIYPHEIATDSLRLGWARARAMGGPRVLEDDILRLAMEDARAEVLFTGIKASDSFMRRQTMNRTAGIDLKRRRCYPIIGWLDANVYSYLRHRRIPLPSRLGSEAKGSGLSFKPNVLSWLRQHHPADFARVCEVFPDAESLALRYELARADSVPGR